MILNGKKLKLIDTSEKITIADSYVVDSQKLGKAHGEAKLFLAKGKKMDWDFYGLKKNPSIKCFIQKKEINDFFNDLEPEYLNPMLPYKQKSKLPMLYNLRKEKLAKLNDIIWFKLDWQKQIKGDRVYLNTQNEDYKLLCRELPLPRICYLIIVKYKHANSYIFKLRLLTDYRTISETNDHPKIIQRENKKIEKTKIGKSKVKIGKIKTRIGQDIFRDRVLKRAPFCPITGVTDERLLQAAHIKPWKDSSPSEKVDPSNGIMLTLTIHKLFDDGFFTFVGKKIKLSPYISPFTFKKLGMVEGQTFSLLRIDGSKKYFQFRNDNIFKS